MIYIVLLFSFYLDGILSYINIASLTTLLSLIIIYPYLINHKKKYFIICFIVGLLYDIAYTNTFLLNASIFLLLGYLISTNIVNNTIITSITIITIYRILTFLLLVFINYLEFNINILFNSIIYSLPFNIIYFFLIYKIFRGIYRKD